MAHFSLKRLQNFILKWMKWSMIVQNVFEIENVQNSLCQDEIRSQMDKYFAVLSPHLIYNAALFWHKSSAHIQNLLPLDSEPNNLM